MQFKFRLMPQMPQLSWCAYVRPGSETVEVTHGLGVEVADGAFSEGAWAGAFHDGAFDRAFMTGTGAKLTSDGVLFVAPSHSQENLIALKRDDGIFFSNSLVLPLIMSGDSLRTDFPYYQNYLYSYVHGLARAASRLPTQSGEIRLFYECNVEIDSQGRLAQRPKLSDPSFSDYRDYKAFLIKSVDALFLNAADDARKTKYWPIATISSGYDSAAAAAIAGTGGCKEALTFLRHNPAGEVIDHGGGTAAALGMRLTEGSRFSYLEKGGIPEAEFLACGLAGEDTPMLAWEQNLKDRILVTGVFGDGVWEPPPKGSPPKRSRASGRSLFEFRSRVGFVHLPLPRVGAGDLDSIWEISRSAEMSPWSVEAHYDRPIPRRILDEAGVPASAFGTHKRGFLLKFSLRSGDAVGSGVGTLAGSLSPQSEEQFMKFVSHNEAALRRYRRVEFRARPLRRLDRRLRKRRRPLSRGAKAFVGWMTRALLGNTPERVLNAPYGVTTLLPLWGITLISERYQKALSEEDSVSADE